MRKLVAVRKGQQGKITHFLTDQDQVITLQQAAAMARKGEIDSITGILPDGTWVIDDTVQHLEGHNLGDLPEF